MPEILWVSFEKMVAVENMGAAEGTQTHVEMFEEFWCGLQGKHQEQSIKQSKLRTAATIPLHVYYYHYPVVMEERRSKYWCTC